MENKSVFHTDTIGDDQFAVEVGAAQIIITVNTEGVSVTLYPKAETEEAVGEASGTWAEFGGSWSALGLED